MSVGTLDVKIVGDLSLAAAQLNLAAIRLDRAFRQFSMLLRYAVEREEAEAEHRVARLMQRADPHLDVQCVTANEGRCRVVVRRLGGWA